MLGAGGIDGGGVSGGGSDGGGVSGGGSDGSAAGGAGDGERGVNAVALCSHEGRDLGVAEGLVALEDPLQPLGFERADRLCEVAEGGWVG